MATRPPHWYFLIKVYQIPYIYTMPLARTVGMEAKTASDATSQSPGRPLHSFSISYCGKFFTFMYSVVSLRIWIPLFGSHTRTQLPFNGFVTAVSLKNPKRSADDMNELAACMSCDEQSVLALCSLHRRFVSRLICFLRGDLSPLK